MQKSLNFFLKSSKTSVCRKVASSFINRKYVRNATTDLKLGKPKFETLLTEDYQPQNFEYNFVADKNTGLVGLELYNLEDFDKLMKNARTKCEDLRNEIVNLKEEDCSSKKEFAEKILNLSDEISNQLCLFLDAMEFIRCIDPRTQFRQKADSVHSEFSLYLHKLNTDVPLHAKMGIVAKDKSLFDLLDPVQQRCIELLYLDMEKHGGVNQQTEEQRIVELRSNMDYLTYSFSESVSKFNRFESNDASLVEMSPKDENFSKNYNYLFKGQNGRYYIYPNYYSNILAFEPNSELRRKVYISKFTSSEKNLQILDDLLTARDNYAKELSYPSYAHWYLNDQCAGNPETVKQFLTNLSKEIKPKVEQELDILRELKKDSTINEWDSFYYRRIAMKQIKPFSVNISEYFPLHKVIEGLYSICEKLFGVKLEPVKLSEHECYHPSVRKLAVVHETEGLLGFIYLDLFSRESKNVDAANFSVRCAKTSIHQLPVTALVCNIDPTIIDDSKKKVYLLSHSEVTTIFHEMGHALHVIFGQTPYQNLSGTRTSIDFVETPSQFMEHFAWDYRVLQDFARHYKTNEPLPISQFEILKKRREMFLGLDTQEQILFGLMDITFHSGWPIIDPITKRKKTTPEVFNEIKAEYSCIPPTEGTSYPGQFIHFTNYGAGYYSYLYSKVFSDHMWHKFYAPLTYPLNREAGEKFRKEALCGGSKDPKQIVRDMLGEEPNPKYFLKNLTK
ncbi:hypothetical protein ABK040_003674 [Willaertia magna]